MRHRSTASRCTRFGAVLVLLAAGTIVWPDRTDAQTVYGSVVGVVRDASQAALPGVTVTLENRQTGLVLTATSGEAGNYALTNVLPGTYDLRASLEGFDEVTRSAISVSAGSVSRIEVTLEIGGLTEIVTVASDVGLLQTDKADTSTGFRSDEIADLPLADYRNYQSLLDLVPGSTPAEFQNAEMDTPARALQTTINGTNPNNNSTRVDGATNQFTWLPHHTLYVAPAETIEAVNVSTSSFEADQGLAGGAAVSVTTKSGTNELKGSAFAFYSDERFRAQDFFAKQNAEEKLPTSHHIDGGTIGGPIVRNTLFFFGAFEGQYRRTSDQAINSVPTEALRRGDFSDAFNSDEALQVIYDPLTGDEEGRDRAPFPNNQIPADRLDPIAQRVLEFYPLPNLEGNSANYFRQFINTFDRNQYDLKINWNRSPAHQLWGKVGVMDSDVSNLHKLGFEGEGGGLGKTTTWVGTIGQTLTLSPTLVVDSTFGYSHLDQFGYGPDFGVNYGLDVLGIPGTNGPDIRHSGFPELATGFTAVGPTETFFYYERDDPSWSFSTNITKLAGKHQLKFGGAIDRQHLNHWQPEQGEGGRGYLAFSGNLSALNGGEQAPNFYNTFASFLMGLTSNAQKSLQWETMTTREWRFGLYLNDRWHVTDRLTVSMGVRWEYFPLVQRADRGVERLDLDTMEVLLGGVGDTPRDVGLQTRATDFAPRIGVAYRVNEETVARVGYGLTYNPLPFARPLRGFYPLTVANTFVSLSSWQPLGTLAEGIPEFSGPDRNEARVPLPEETSMRTPDPDNIHRGYIQSWNVAIERRLPFNISLTTAYVGTKTTRGYADRELNVAPTGGNGGRVFVEEFNRTASTLLWGGITRSNYHSLQIALDRPFRDGLFLKGAYTYGKALNMADQDGWVGLSFSSDSEYHRNYAPAGFDRRHNFQIGFVYRLPFAEHSSPSIGSALVKDWQINGTLAAYTGTPFTVTASNAALDQVGDTQTADQVAEPRYLGPSADGPLYDTSAWENITEARYGNSGRNSVYGPGRWNLNMSVFRTFPLGARMRLQFRVEGFNITNRIHWNSPPDSWRNVGNANFMQINSTGPAREVRLGLRLTF